jgi:hypothetical protein
MVFHDDAPIWNSPRIETAAPRSFFLPAPLKLAYILIATLLLGSVSRAEILIPSQVDSTHSEAREKAFIPWSTPEESSDYWKKLSSSHVPIYKELKDGNLGRDLYIPNPGIGYWVLGGLTEKALWKTHEEKLKIGDELVSATIYKDEKGVVTYWALWAPESKAYLLKDRMKEFGITPAKVEYTLLDKTKMLSADLEPYKTVAIVAVPFILSLILLSLIVLLGLVRRKHPSGAA